MSRSGIVNVRMVITEEKILSNIDKIQKMINPNSKKQIVQLEDDSYFKDLIESIKSYLIEYPKKKNFPVSVYKAAYALVENATNQFEENTKKIEELIRQREENIALAGKLKGLIASVKTKQKGWRDLVKAAEDELPEEIIEALGILGKSKSVKSESYQDSLKLLNARVNNLESNLHIEIDMERIEDRSKALSYIGIEVADALKGIPAPIETLVEKEEVQKYIIDSRAVVLPSRWYEGAPLTPLEAMQYRIPCIVSNCSAACEYIIEGRNGFVFDLENLTNVIRKYEENISSFKNDVYFEKIINEYKTDKYINSLINLYNKIIK